MCHFNGKTEQEVQRKENVAACAWDPETSLRFVLSFLIVFFFLLFPTSCYFYFIYHERLIPSLGSMILFSHVFNISFFVDAIRQRKRGRK